MPANIRRPHWVKHRSRTLSRAAHIYNVSMQDKVTNVLFVSKKNAARSLLAEACLRHIGGQKFRVYSCGDPKSVANVPSHWSILVLTTAGIDTSGLHCKDWSVFARPSAPQMDLVIGVDERSYMKHPSWPGQPITALWAYDRIELDSKKSTNLGVATAHTLHSLRRRLELLVALHSKLHRSAELHHDLRDLAHY